MFFVRCCFARLSASLAWRSKRSSLLPPESSKTFSPTSSNPSRLLNSPATLGLGAFPSFSNTPPRSVPTLKIPQRPSRTASLPYTKPIASTSTSFERGSDATRSPPASSRGTSISPEPVPRPRMDEILDRVTKRSPGATTMDDVLGPAAKRRRSDSIGHLSILPVRPRDTTVSTSAVRLSFVFYFPGRPWATNPS